MQIVKTQDDITPFYAEVKGRITSIKEYEFLCLIKAVYNKIKINPNSKYYLQVGK